MSDWINHVKRVQREEGISYKEALKIAKHSYKGGSIESQKIRNFIYKKGFNPDRFKSNIKSDFIKKKMYLAKTHHHKDDKIGLKMSNDMIEDKLDVIDDKLDDIDEKYKNLYDEIIRLKKMLN